MLYFLDIIFLLLWVCSAIFQSSLWNDMISISLLRGQRGTHNIMAKEWGHPHTRENGLPLPKEAAGLFSRAVCFPYFKGMPTSAPAKQHSIFSWLLLLLLLFFFTWPFPYGSSCSPCSSRASESRRGKHPHAFHPHPLDPC